MRIEILPSGWVTVSKGGGVTITRGGSEQIIAFNPDEQRELLEALARANSFTLLDQAELATLQGLVEEIEDDENDYANPYNAWNRWQDRAEAFASAVTQALEA